MVIRHSHDRFQVHLENRFRWFRAIQVRKVMKTEDFRATGPFGPFIHLVVSWNRGTSILVGFSLIKFRPFLGTPMTSWTIFNDLSTCAVTMLAEMACEQGDIFRTLQVDMICNYILYIPGPSTYPVKLCFISFYHNPYHNLRSFTIFWYLLWVFAGLSLSSLHFKSLSKIFETPSRAQTFFCVMVVTVELSPFCTWAKHHPTGMQTGMES